MNKQLSLFDRIPVRVSPNFDKGDRVKIHVPDYPKEKTDPVSVWETGQFHGLVGEVIESDEDGPDGLLTAVLVRFDDGREYYFWEREMKAQRPCFAAST